MRTNEDIEGYLIELETSYEQLEEGLWRVEDEDGHVDIIVQHMPPIIVFRVKVMDIPQHNQTELYAELLRLNDELLAGAYAIESETKSIVLVDTLQSTNLDFNELQASIESLSLAITEHYPVLKDFREKAASEATEVTE